MKLQRQKQLFIKRKLQKNQIFEVRVTTEENETTEKYIFIYQN